MAFYKITGFTEKQWTFKLSAIIKHMFLVKHEIRKISMGVGFGLSTRRYGYTEQTPTCTRSTVSDPVKYGAADPFTKVPIITINYPSLKKSDLCRPSSCGTRLCSSPGSGTRSGWSPAPRRWSSSANKARLSSSSCTKIKRKIYS
jgi:hypothetical protein